MTEELRDSDSRRADRLARETAQRVFDRPLVLEAGAGTGKTSALVARVAAWCLGPGWERAELRHQADPPQPGAHASREGSALRELLAAEVLSRVAAITFTEAAAAEMAERAGQAFAAVAGGGLVPGLSDSALPDDLDERRARATALLGALDHLAVRTIHAWCRGLLARHPLESGLHPDFEVDADMRLQIDLVRDVVEESVRRAYASEGSPLLELALLGHGAAELEETLVALVAEGMSAAALRADPFAAERVDPFVAGLRAAVTALLDCDAGRLGEVPQRAKLTHTALRALERTAALAAGFKCDGLASLEVFCDAVAEAWPGKSLARLGDWSKGKLIAGEAEALADSAGEYADLAAALLPFLQSLVDLSPRVLQTGREVLRPMLEAVHAELRARGVATFESLLSGARELLEKRADVRRRVRLELDQLLVDEFQDTDALQCAIVRALALSGPEAERPGLFLVGDPKQSIYGWRSADLEAYDGFVREVEEAGGEVHSLTVNFRSVPAILDEVERAIEPVMQRRPGLQPRFQKLDVSPARVGDAGYCTGGRAPVEYWVSWRCAGRDGQDGDAGDADEAPVGAKTRSGDATQIEAQAVARDLALLHEGEGVPWRDMALLFRGTGDLEEYLAAFRERGVPYAVERDRNYYRRREVIDAAAWLRCVLDPNDQLALLTLLRSPSVGVPDAALIPLWAHGFPSRVAELYGAAAPALPALMDLSRQVAAQLSEREHEVPGLERVRGWEASLVAMLQTLSGLRESFERDAADVFVERLRLQSLLEVSEAARYLGAHRVANLDRFFRELRNGLIAGGDAQAILRRLRGDIASGRDEEEQRPMGEAEDAVPVMTIHKAKGLDFEHVYLAQLHKRSRPNVAPATALAPGVQRDGQTEYRLFSQSTLGFERARAAARRVEAAERVRTLYVAMTRAKSRLVLLGSWGAASEPLAYERASSHIELLAGRLAPRNPGEPGVDLESMMQSCSEAGRASEDAAGVRWVFPVLQPKEPARARPARQLATPLPRLPTLQEISQQRDTLAALQQRARVRMLRRWSGQASQDAHLRAVDDDSYAGREREDGGREPCRLVPRSGGLVPQSGGRAPQDGEAAPARHASMLAGIAIHRVLEDLDLTADPSVELARQRDGLALRVAQAGGGSGAAHQLVHDPALERAEALLERFAAGSLAQRLWQLAPQVIARELEVWLPAAPDGGSDAADHGPLRYVAGALDLVYRDPASGEWVVADYKSDRVQSREDVEARAAQYAGQGATYTRALQEALALADRPRFELWFLDADEVVIVSDPASS